MSNDDFSMAYFSEAQKFFAELKNTRQDLFETIGKTRVGKNFLDNVVCEMTYYIVNIEPSCTHFVADSQLLHYITFMEHLIIFTHSISKLIQDDKNLCLEVVTDINPARMCDKLDTLLSNRRLSSTALACFTRGETNHYTLLIVDSKAKKIQYRYLIFELRYERDHFYIEGIHQGKQWDEMLTIRSICLLQFAGATTGRTMRLPEEVGRLLSSDNCEELQLRLIAVP
jgi:hypothetical protein